MASKTYCFDFGLTKVCVEATQEGESRYMVRLLIPGRMAPVRIGYLTGNNRRWLAEFPVNRPSLLVASAKAACFELAKFATGQATVAPFLSKS